MDVDLHRFVYDLIADHAHDASGADADDAISELGLTFEYTVRTSLNVYTFTPGRTYQTKAEANAIVAKELVYIDSLRNRPAEFRNAQASALRIERRIVGRWETP